MTTITVGKPYGIADTNAVRIDGSPNDDEFARFTANGLEGRTVAETRGDLGLATTDTPEFDGLVIGSDDGIDVNPGSDVDCDLITVGVTGSPRFAWDESETALVVQVIPSGSSTPDIGRAGIQYASYDSLSGGFNVNHTARVLSINNDAYGDGFHIHYARQSGNDGVATTVASGDQIGNFAFRGYNASGSVYQDAAAVVAVVDGEPATAGDTTDMPGRLIFSTTANGAGSVSERLRIDSAGDIMIGRTSVGNSNRLSIEKSGQSLIHVNRTSSDGNLIEFAQAGTIEGNINVSGTTIALTGAHLSRWSQWDGADPGELPRGTILSNRDAMCEWKEIIYDFTEVTYEQAASGSDIRVPVERTTSHRVNYLGSQPVGGTDTYMHAGKHEVTGTIELSANDQLNRIAVSDVVADRNVCGVFQGLDEDGEPNVAQSGDYVVRVNGGVTVSRGDLIESNGDGTGRVQDDDVVRAKTVAKVTSGFVAQTFADGSYLVPCTLMAGG